MKEAFLRTREGQEIENVIVNKYRELLGGNLLVVVTGGACTPTPVKHFLNGILADGNDCRAVDSYGSTEFPGISSNGEVADNVELKLIPVYSSDGSEIYPGTTEGEIVVRRKEDVPETFYVNRTDLTKKAWDLHLNSGKPIPKYHSTGWYYTGDVGKLVDGKLQVTDRVSNLEEIYYHGDSVWIEPGRLEALYNNALSDIKHVVLCCDRNRSGLGLIVSVNENSTSTNNQITKSLTAIAIKSKLPEYCHPVGIVVTREVWSNENTLLTLTGKANRSAIKRRYDSELGSSFALFESGKGFCSKQLPSETNQNSQPTPKTNDILIKVFNDAYESTSYSEAQMELFQKTGIKPTTYKKGSRKVNLQYTTLTGELSETETAAGRDWINGVEKFKFFEVRDTLKTSTMPDITNIPTNTTIKLDIVNDDNSISTKTVQIDKHQNDNTSQLRRRVAHYLDVSPSRIQFNSESSISVQPLSENPSKHFYQLTDCEIQILTSQFNRVVDKAMSLRELLNKKEIDQKSKTKQHIENVDTNYSNDLKTASDKDEIFRILRCWKRDMMRARESDLRGSGFTSSEQLLWDELDKELLRLREIGDSQDVDTRSLPVTWRLDVQWISAPKQKTTQCMFGCGRLIVSSQLTEHTNNFNGPCNMEIGISTDDVSTQMGGDQSVYCDSTGSIIDHEEYESTTKPLPYRSPRYHNIDNHRDRRFDVHNKILHANNITDQPQWILDKQHIFWLHKYTCAGKDLGFFDTPASLISRSCDAFENRPALGISMRQLNRPRCTSVWTLPEAVGIKPIIHNNSYWLDYKGVWRIVSSVAEIIRSKYPTGTFIALLGYNELEWIVSDFAIALAGMVSVPVHTSFTQEQVIAHLNRTKVSCLFTMRNLFNKSLFDSCSGLKEIIVMDGLSDVTSDSRVLSLPEAIIANPGLSQNTLPKEFGFDRSGGVFKNEEICTILSTSGTTGKPKLVAIPTRGFVNDLVGDIQERLVISKSLTISYIPLSHSSDRYKVWQHFLMGGRVSFCYYPAQHWSSHENDKKDAMIEYTSPVEELFQQVSDVNPTSMACPPNIWSGLRELKESSYPTTSLIDFSKIVFGTRIAYLATGGSPTPRYEYLSLGVFRENNN